VDYVSGLELFAFVV